MEKPNDETINDDNLQLINKVTSIISCILNPSLHLFRAIFLAG